jgi:hypothetical protein
MLSTLPFDAWSPEGMVSLTLTRSRRRQITTRYWRHMSTLTYSHPRARRFEATAELAGTRVAALPCAGLSGGSQAAEKFRTGRKNNERARIPLCRCSGRLWPRIGHSLSPAFSQAAKWPSKPPIPHRHAKTTRLFKAPGLYPNGLAISPDALWIRQQKISALQ